MVLQQLKWWVLLFFIYYVEYLINIKIICDSWLQIVFPLYLWLLTFLVILCSKYSKHIRKLLGSNPVAMLATIILLSYKKIIQFSQDALSSVTVTSFYKNGSNKTMIYWKFYPILIFNEGKHIPLLIFAVCLLIILVAPYTLLLLLGYRLQAFSSKRGCRWINKLKPLLVAYYAPYTSYKVSILAWTTTCYSCLCSSL